MLRLEKLTYRNVREITNLRVTEGQENFAASNVQSIIEAFIVKENSKSEA